MARLARVVIPGMAHHVTQRGNGRQQTFFGDDDYRLYLRLLSGACESSAVQCLAYCLMPNHAHLILVPAVETGLATCLARVHGTYAAILNASRRRSGHFWQGRYYSTVMDAAHRYEALRYVLLNPVRGGLVASAGAWQWSSAATYLSGVTDDLTNAAPLRPEIGDVATYLAAAPDQARVARLRTSLRTGRPAVLPALLPQLEALTGRRLARRPPGPTARGVRQG